NIYFSGIYARILEHQEHERRKLSSDMAKKTLQKLSIMRKRNLRNFMYSVFLIGNLLAAAQNNLEQNNFQIPLFFARILLNIEMLYRSWEQRVKVLDTESSMDSEDVK